MSDLRKRAADRHEITSLAQGYGEEHPDAWAGLYIEGNAVVVMLVDPTGERAAELQRQVNPTAQLVIRSASRSLRDLTALQDRIAVDGWLIANYHVLEAGVDVEHNVVSIEVSSSDARAPAAIEAHYGAGDALSVSIDGTGVARLPTGTISGRAVDRDGQPVAGLAIQLIPDLAGVDTGEIAWSTRRDGTFRIDVPATGYEIRLVIDVDAAGHPAPTNGIQVGIARVEVKAGKTTQVTVTVAWP